jgi:hypothetical protein
VSSWESLTSPKTPPADKISAYARLFCTRRSLEGGLHLIPEDELTPVELKRYGELKEQLLELLHPEEREMQRSFQFDDGPVIVICPDLPPDARGPLANEHHPNFTKMQQYGDLDALIELYGYIRAENPALDVFHRPASELQSDDLLGHVILIGGVGWNKVTQRIQSATSQVPITQEAVVDLKDGDIFRVKTSDGKRSFYPEYGDFGEGNELTADVAYLARLGNPFKVSHTLTICNGIFSRGVLGAVRCLTDSKVRVANEKFLTEQFPDGQFAMLLRVPVVDNQAMAPDLQNPDALLYEWKPKPNGPR